MRCQSMMMMTKKVGDAPQSPLQSVKFNAVPVFATAAVLLPLLQADAADITTKASASASAVVDEPKVDLGPPPTH